MNAASEIRPSLEALLRPRSIAVVGASVRPGSAGSGIIENLKRVGFSGQIYPINPRYPEIHGLRAYASLTDIGAPVDAVFIAVAAQYGPDILREAIGIGAKAVLINATGYADAGEEGRARQAEIVELAGRAGIPICGPNNLGLVNIADAIPLWAADHIPTAKPGPVAIISQSGSVALALGEDPAGLGLSYVITAGNEAVTGVADYVSAIAQDDRVKLVLLFLETIRNPQALAEAVAQARAAGQTVLAMKVGRSERARAAVTAHSGALSGEDAVVSAFFRQHGIERVHDLDDLVQFARLKLLPPPKAGTQPAYITLSGGQGAAIADVAADARLNVLDFPPVVVERLRPLFGGGVAQNPCDAWGLGWDPEWFGRLLDSLLAAPEIDPIVLSLDVPATGHADGPMAVEMARMVAQLSLGAKSMFFTANSAISGVNAELEAICRAHRIPILMGTGAALRALAAWIRPLSARADPSGRIRPGSLGKLETEARLKREVTFVTAERAASPAEAARIADAIGYPVVLKGMAPNAVHKTELGLVRLGLSTGAAVSSAFEELNRILATNASTLGQGWIEIQPMIASGIELLVAARRDPVFGPVVVVGAGGKLVELIADTALRLGVVTEANAGEMLAETRIGTLLQGYRDGVGYDIAAARGAIAALSRVIAEAGPEVKAIEINPLIVMPEGGGAVAVDLVIE